MAKRLSNEEIIAALIECGTVKKASSFLGCKEHTIYNRMKQPDFEALYSEAKLEIVKTATASIQGHLSEAIQTLIDIMKDPETAAQTRANCAESIIRNSLRLTEQTDIIAQIEELKKNQAAFIKLDL